MLKYLTVLFVSFLVAGTISAQVTPTPIVHPDQKMEKPVNLDGPVMDFETKTVDYGTLEQHGDPLKVIKFTNTGKEPLVIKNAKGSCGCTVPTWPKEPVMPGETSEIEVRYATNRLGKINKTIKITTNEGTDPHVLKVIGNILKKEEEESVPKTTPNMLSGSGN